MKLLEQSQIIKKAKDKVFQDLMEKYNLTSNELNIIMFLNQSDNDTARDIVNEFLFTKSHVSVSVDLLIRKGYLTKQTDTTDKKVNHLKITSKANKLIDDTKERKQQFLSLIFEGVDSEDKKVVEKVFTQIDKNINNIINS